MVGKKTMRAMRTMMSALAISASLTSVAEIVTIGGTNDEDYFQDYYGATFDINTAKKTATLVAIDKDWGFYDLQQPLEIDGVTYAITAIGDGVFEGDTDLTELYLPDELISIGNRAFYGCSNLRVVKLPEKLESIGNQAFYGTDELCAEGVDNQYYFHVNQYLMLPKTMKTIGYEAFANSKIPAVTILGLESMGERAFAESSLEWVEIYNVEKIANSAFINNTYLQRVDLYGNIKEIGDSAFYGIYDVIDEIVIPASVSKIGNYCFAPEQKYYDYVGTLRDLKFEDSTKPLELGENAFANFDFTKLYLGRNIATNMFSLMDMDTLDKKEGNGGLTDLVIGNLVTELQPLMFAGNTQLREVTFGTGLTEIPEGAFRNCALYDMILPSNIESIGMFSFSDNMSLNSLTIGSGIQTISDYAFALSQNLSSITIAADPLPTLSEGAFMGVSEENPPALYMRNDATYESTPIYITEGEGTEWEYSYPSGSSWDFFNLQYNGYIPATSVKIEKGTTSTRSIGNSDVLTNEPQQIQLKGYVLPTYATNTKVFWRSSNPEVASVDNYGLVTIYNPKANFNIIAESFDQSAPSSMMNFNYQTLSFEEIVPDKIVDLGDDGSVKAPVPNDVYNIQGMLIKRNASQADVDALPAGFYIYAGKKIFVK